MSFKEIDSPDVLASAQKVFSITATCEGPGSIITVYDNDEGFYLPTDEKEDRTIEWFADSDQNGIVKSVIINGEEDKSFAGKEDGSYITTSGDVSVHVIFE